ncbi:hypothetical protein [Coralloluteibacterium thermophilus]|uniref:Uncharacterized protein n=1 Tax=Coralloluteibacterium thermophilum TaxID=2707049 RepID=A0ABV9NLP9_9GAMM
MGTPSSRRRRGLPLEIHDAADDGTGELQRRITDAVTGLLGRTPYSSEPASAVPRLRSQAIADAAARRAGVLAGSLSLPPGPMGWMTVLPELYAIWNIQSQMVADIAAAHGQHWRLGREQMLFCLFRHTAAQAFRDFAVRAGQRWLIQSATQEALVRAVRHVGVHLSRRALTRGVSRWVPLLGAVGVGAYAWYDTREVARTAIELFSQEDVRDIELPRTS